MEKASYFSSSMVLFNVFYIIKNLSLLDFIKGIDFHDLKTLFIFISIGIAGIFLLWGIMYTAVLSLTNFNPQKSENGKEYAFVNKQDVTSTEFLGKFSLLIMTGLTIGGIPLWWGTSLYFLFNFAIFVIYCRCDMIYLNPILTLVGYKTYKCECKGSQENETIYFILKNIDMSDKKSIKSTMTNKKIIRLVGKSDESTN